MTGELSWSVSLNFGASSINECKGPRLNTTWPTEARQEWVCQLLVSSPYLKIERRKSTDPHRREKATDIDEGKGGQWIPKEPGKAYGLANPPRILPGNFARPLPPVGPNHCQPPLGTNISHRVISHLARRVIGSDIKEYHKILLGLNPRHYPLGTNISHRDQLQLWIWSEGCW